MSAATTCTGEAQTNAGTKDHPQPEPSGPRADQVARTEDSADAPPTPPTGPKLRKSTEDAGAGATGEAEDKNREGPDRSQRTEPVTVVDLEAAPVPTAGLGAQALPAAPPTTAHTSSGKPCPGATHQPEAEMRASHATGDTDRQGTGTGGSETRQETDAPLVPAPGSGPRKPPTAPADPNSQPETNVSGPTLPPTWRPRKHATTGQPGLRKR